MDKHPILGGGGGGSNDPSPCMLGILWWKLASHPGGSNNTLSCFMLQKPELSAGTDETPGSFNVPD